MVGLSCLDIWTALQSLGFEYRQVCSNLNWFVELCWVGKFLTCLNLGCDWTTPRKWLQFINLCCCILIPRFNCKKIKPLSVTRPTFLFCKAGFWNKLFWESADSVNRISLDKSISENRKKIISFSTFAASLKWFCIRESFLCFRPIGIFCHRQLSWGLFYFYLIGRTPNNFWLAGSPNNITPRSE